MPKISIVLRSRNDAQFAEKTAAAILSQKLAAFEILDFDNASTDGTREIMAKFPQIRIIDVPEGAYVPGKILNAAARECSGDIIVFNNCDAVPQNSDWLENIARPIIENGAAAVYARQICRHDAEAWVRRDCATAFGDSPMSAEFFSMASSAARADMFEKYPFDENIKYSEDLQWARRLRAGGLTTAYAPDAITEHSHNYTLPQIRRRFAGEGTADAEIYGGAQSFLKCVKGLLGAWARDIVFCLKNGATTEILHCLRVRWAQKISYWSARKSAAKGGSK